MLIREIISADAAAYHRLRVQSEAEFPQFVGFNAERELVAGAGGIEALLAGYPAEGSCVLGAFAGSALIGTVVLSRRLSPKYRHKAFLWGMYVVPECRGGEAAPALMHAAIDRATAHPELVAVSLQVTQSNLRGQRFYRRFGFTVFGTERRSLFAGGCFHDVHYMERDVK